MLNLRYIRRAPPEKSGERLCSLEIWYSSDWADKSLPNEKPSFGWVQIPPNDLVWMVKVQGCKSDRPDWPLVLVADKKTLSGTEDKLDCGPWHCSCAFSSAPQLCLGVPALNRPTCFIQIWQILYIWVRLYLICIVLVLFSNDFSWKAGCHLASDATPGGASIHWQEFFYLGIKQSTLKSLEFRYQSTRWLFSK